MSWGMHPPPPTLVTLSSSGEESVDKWRCCAHGTGPFEARPGRFMSALSQAELWLIDAVLRGHRPGRGQPALCCLHREIPSKRPAACVKKILHSGSAQMNPGGAWNCFQWHSSQYIITWWSSVTNDICKCGFSWRFRPDIFTHAGCH